MQTLTRRGVGDAAAGLSLHFLHMAFNTEWFDIKCGLRQGCILSPILFNLYINDLALYLKSLDIGIQVGNEQICILMYSYDIVLLAENNDDLQLLLNSLNNWCGINGMNINGSKSNIEHFRTNSQAKTTHVFKCGEIVLDIVDRYKYLGVILQENLDLNITAKAVAKSTNRALGLLVARLKLKGGVPYNVFTKLYYSVVWPVIGYSAPIWGFKQFRVLKPCKPEQCDFIWE